MVVVNPADRFPAGWGQIPGQPVPKFRQIPVEATRIGIKILTGAKLRWIDEDADHDEVGVRVCLIDQGEVAIMKRTHSGDQPNAVWPSCDRVRRAIPPPW